MIRQLHAFFTGMLINIQFFTTVPIKDELPMDRMQMKYTLQTLPILGLLQGGIYAFVIFLLQSYTSFSNLIIAFCLWLVLIVLSGGIHLDGLIDTSDAYFSYQDVTKRLKIMQDPRVGAFGVLSIIVFLAARFLILYELIAIANPWTYIFIVIIPFLGKMYMASCLHRLPPARDQGMAVFFQQGASKNFWFMYGIYVLIIGIAIAMINTELLTSYFILVFLMILVGCLLAKKTVKNFGGITGDTLGAGTEGMELLLWITVWLLHFYAMV